MLSAQRSWIRGETAAAGGVRATSRVDRAPAAGTIRSRVRRLTLKTFVRTSYVRRPPSIAVGRRSGAWDPEGGGSEWDGTKTHSSLLLASYKRGKKRGGNKRRRQKPRQKPGPDDPD